jgi:sugar phosphate permease
MSIAAQQNTVPPPVLPIAERTRRHITRRLAPFLFILYVLNYMDRVNVSYAALDMTGDLGFSNAVFGFGAGVFFVGYFLLQVPGTVLLEVWSARRFMGDAAFGLAKQTMYGRPISLLAAARSEPRSASAPSDRRTSWL